MKGWLTVILSSAIVLAQANTPQWLSFAADDIDISPSPYYRSQTKQQLESQQVELTGILRYSGIGYDNWDVETSDHEIFHIQNSQPWANESWFKVGSKVRIIGNLRPDIRQSDANKPTLVAGHIYPVKASQVKNKSIPEQIENQVTQENATKYAKKVPFLKRLLNKIGL